MPPRGKDIRPWPRRVAGLVCIVFFLLVPSRAPATVAEQRARLPPPAHCTDPVAGVWKSHKYDPRHRDWYVFTLNIHRAEDDETRLEGTIRSHSWNGTPREEEPPPCRAGLFHWTVMMEAQGSIGAEGEVRFWGTQWRPENVYCGRGPSYGQYNLDHFSGVIDAEIQEFQSVNNDGGRSVNDPTVFRRISCHEAPPAPHVNPVPPPFVPEGGGCCSPF